MAESKEELKSLLMRVKEESEKVDLKPSIQKTKIMASGPITSWQIDGQTMETITDFFFLASKITADGDDSHEIKMLAPWKKSYVQPRQHSKKQRHYFANKCLSSQGYGFSSSHVWMWDLDYKESWAPKNWCFWTVVLEKTLGQQGDPTSPSSRKSVLNIHWKDWCWSLLQYFGHLMGRTAYWKRPWCWERLKAGGEGDDGGLDVWISLPTQWTEVWANSRRWWRAGKPGVLQSMGSQRIGHYWSLTHTSNNYLPFLLKLSETPRVYSNS